MPDLEIFITPSAEKDMQDIFDFIAADNKIKALEIIDKFEKKIETIAAFPRIGVRKSYFVKRDVRECIVAKHYQIIYYIKGNTLYVQRILTGYEDYFHS